MLLVRIQYESIEIWYSSKSLWLFSHFDAENYARRYDMVQNFFVCLIFLGQMSQNIYQKIFKTV